MAIIEFNDDFSFAVGDESFDSEVCDEFFIFSQFPADIAQVFNCQFLIGGDEDDVGLNPEQDSPENEYVSEGG